MKKGATIALLLFFVISISTSVTVAQGKYGLIGKTFTNKEATELFGAVLGSVKVSKAFVKNAIKAAGDYVLIAVKNNRVRIMNEKRATLIDDGYLLPNGEVAYMFSTIVLEDFLNSSKSEIVSVELRASTLTVSNDFNTLEMAFPCPPTCPD